MVIIGQLTTSGTLVGYFLEIVVGSATLLELLC